MSSARRAHEHTHPPFGVRAWHPRWTVLMPAESQNCPEKLARRGQYARTIPSASLSDGHGCHIQKSPKSSWNKKFLEHFRGVAWPIYCSNVATWARFRQNLVRSELQNHLAKYKDFRGSVCCRPAAGEKHGAPNGCHYSIPADRSAALAKFTIRRRWRTGLV